VHSLLPPNFKFDFNAELESTELGPPSLTRYGMQSASSLNWMLLLTHFVIAMSKLANLLFAKQLQKVFDAEGVQAISISLNPGDVKTSK